MGSNAGRDEKGALQGLTRPGMALERLRASVVGGLGKWVTEMRREKGRKTKGPGTGVQKQKEGPGWGIGICSYINVAIQGSWAVLRSLREVKSTQTSLGDLGAL